MSILKKQTPVLALNLKKQRSARAQGQIHVFQAMCCLNICVHACTQLSKIHTVAFQHMQEWDPHVVFFCPI